MKFLLRMLDRWDEWCLTAPFWQIVLVALIVLPLWLACAAVVSLTLLDVLLRMLS